MATFVKVISAIVLLLGGLAAFGGLIELFSGYGSEKVQGVGIIAGSILVSLFAGVSWLFADFVRTKGLPPSAS